MMTRKHNASHLMTAREAQEVIEQMELQVKSAKKRKQLISFFSTNVAGKLSQEAIHVYKSYAGIV